MLLAHHTVATEVKMDLLSSFFDHHNKELGAILPRRSAVRKKLIPCVHVRHSTRNTTQMAIIPTLIPPPPPLTHEQI